MTIASALIGRHVAGQGRERRGRSRIARVGSHMCEYRPVGLCLLCTSSYCTVEACTSACTSLYKLVLVRATRAGPCVRTSSFKLLLYVQVLYSLSEYKLVREEHSIRLRLACTARTSGLYKLVQACTCTMYERVQGVYYMGAYKACVYRQVCKCLCEDGLYIRTTRRTP